MQIELTSDQFQRLNERAVAAGYDDAASLVTALADEPKDDPRGDLSEEQLRDSVARLKAADAQIDTTGGLDARDAMLELGREFGFGQAE